MTQPTVSISKTGQGTRGIAAAMEKLRRSDVYVGILASDTQRKGDEINNASLLFILTNGSPINNIPATPIIEPAIAGAKALITPELAAAAQATLRHRPDEATKHLKLAGIIGANAAKRYFTEDNGWPPNAPSTVARKGSDERNIDTGQLRRAITSVVHEGDVTTPMTKVETTSISESGENYDTAEAVTLGGELEDIL